LKYLLLFCLKSGNVFYIIQNAENQDMQTKNFASYFYGCEAWLLSSC